MAQSFPQTLHFKGKWGGESRGESRASNMVANDPMLKHTHSHHFFFLWNLGRNGQTWNVIKIYFCHIWIWLSQCSCVILSHVKKRIKIGLTHGARSAERLHLSAVHNCNTTTYNLFLHPLTQWKHSSITLGIPKRWVCGETWWFHCEYFPILTYGEKIMTSINLIHMLYMPLIISLLQITCRQ